MPQSHVFVTRGDLTHLKCDAWLLPGDAAYTVVRGWTDAVEGLSRAVAQLRTQSWDFASGAVRAVPLPGWDEGRPLPVLTAVPMEGVSHPRDVRGALRDFVEVAAASVPRRAHGRRPVPLLGIPAFGTGAGGGGWQRGPVLRELVDSAREAAAEAGVDIALVLRDEADLAMVQGQRRRAPRAQMWPELSGRLRHAAQALGAQAARGQLVPFMGAGVSVSAGAPTWTELIGRLSDRMDLAPAQRVQLEGLDVLDQAHVLRELFAERGEDFGQVVAAEVEVDQYGLAPALIASLPVGQAITLNYDGLFELASQDAGRPVSLLAETPGVATDRWLLKLHGSVRDPSSIVLTREDYLGYGADRAALSAIVKGLLFTHRLLFVGFGLTDDHVHAIVHDVSRALSTGPTDEAMFGTALLPHRDELLARLWKGKVEVLAMEEETGEAASLEDRARVLEIFLDCLLAHAVNSQTFLLRDGYQGELSQPERRLADRLSALAADVSPEERETSSWAVMDEALRSLGWAAGS